MVVKAALGVQLLSRDRISSPLKLACFGGRLLVFTNAPNGAVQIFKMSPERHKMPQSARLTFLSRKTIFFSPGNRLD